MSSRQKGSASLASKIALSVSILIALILGIVISVVSLRLHKDVQDLVQEQSLQITAGFARSITIAINGYYWNLRLLSVNEQLVRGPLDEAGAYIAGSVNKNFSDSVGAPLLILPDGTVIGSPDGKADFAALPFLKQVFEEGKEWIYSDIAYSDRCNEIALTLARSVVGPDGKVRAALCSDFKMSMLLKLISSFKAAKGAVMWVQEPSGRIIAHPDPSIMLSLNTLDSSRLGYRGLDELGERIRKEISGAGLYISPDGTRYKTFFSKIGLTPGEGWRLCLSIPEAELYATARGLIAMLLIIMASSLVVATALSLVIARSISRPVKLVAEEIRGLASGEADLTRKLSVTSRDEIGMLSGDMNLFLDKLRQMVVDIKGTQERLGSIGEELRQSVRGNASAVSQIRERAGHMRDQARSQGECVAQASQAAQEIARTISLLDGLIADQGASITEASASIEQMVGNIASVSKSVSSISSGFDDITASSDLGVSLQKAAGERVAEISALSRTLAEANQAIAGIASQTNLLAMNAAIEAAHAGEAGKGFSVVADEIRKLAETSTSQSKSISSGLKNVQAAISSVVETTRKTGDAFASLAERISQTANLTREVGSAMVEQNEGSGQILSALKQMNEISAQVRSGSKVMSDGNAVNLEAVTRLRSSAEEIGGSVEQVASGIEDMARVTGSVGTAAEKTGDLIQSLEQAVGRFRT